MSRRPARYAARVILAALLGLQVVVAGAAPVGAAESAFRLDLAAKGDYVAQTNFVQCVGASMQMMLNMINPSDDRTLEDAAPTPEPRPRAQRPSRRRLAAQGRQRPRLVGGPQPARRRTVSARRDGNARRGASPRRLRDPSDEPAGRPPGLARTPRVGHERLPRHGRPARDERLQGHRRRSSWIRSIPHGSKVWGPSPKPREALSPKIARPPVRSAPPGQQLPQRLGRYGRGDDVGAGRQVRARPSVRDHPHLATLPRSPLTGG